MDDPIYYLRTKGGDSGPITWGEMRDWVAKGLFTPTDFVWHCRHGRWEWVAAEHVAELQGLFRDMAAEEERIDEAQEEAKRIKAEAKAKGKTPTRLLAIGGGKGGTGKTSVAASIAISLASLDRSVILVDGDLGGANMHICLGMTQAEINLGKFFLDKETELVDILIPTPVHNLRLISGAGGVLGLANPKYSQKLKFINRMRKLEADFIVLDLGAGTTYDTLDLFLAADLGIVVTAPDPFSLQNGFNFLKASTYRMLERNLRKDLEVQELLSGARDEHYRIPLPRLLAMMEAQKPEVVKRIEDALAEFRPGFIANMVMKRSEAREALVVKTATAELLGVEVDYLGFVYFDPAVRTALRQMQPFVVANPRGHAAKCVLDIVVRKVLGTEGLGGFWEKRRLRHRLRESAHPVKSADAANEAAIYEEPI